jgi:hypothetical protein
MTVLARIGNNLIERQVETLMIRLRVVRQMPSCKDDTADGRRIRNVGRRYLAKPNEDVEDYVHAVGSITIV